MRRRTKTGDYADVTVIDADRRRIPWPEVSHIYADVTCALMRQVVDSNLAFTGLVGCGDPGVDGGALSQLNPLGFAAGN